MLTDEGGGKKRRRNGKREVVAHAHTQAHDPPSGGWTHRTMLRFPGTAEQKRSVCAPPLPAHKGAPDRFDAETVD